MSWSLGEVRIRKRILENREDVRAPVVFIDKGDMNSNATGYIKATLLFPIFRVVYTVLLCGTWVIKS